jgi:hypothetical protein
MRTRARALPPLAAQGSPWKTRRTLTKPATLVQQWDHRPDLDFSPASEACDDEVAARYRTSLPKK